MSNIRMLFDASKVKRYTVQFFQFILFLIFLENMTIRVELAFVVLCPYYHSACSADCSLLCSPVLVPGLLPLFFQKKLSVVSSPQQTLFCEVKNGQTHLNAICFTTKISALNAPQTDQFSTLK